MENSIRILEQPASKVKFRMVVQSHRCQNTELLTGKNSERNGTRTTFPAIQLVPRDDRCRLIPKTIVRMSLVDERSTASNILDHFHCLVDCHNNRGEPTWRVEREMNPDGTVLFDKFGIVKTLETDKVDRIAQRIIDRQVDNGDFKLRNDTWRKTRIKDDAEKQCGTTTSTRLKLCFEAFLRDPRGNVKVADPVFSDDIIDSESTANEFAISEISLWSDTVEGGAKLMTFTGNSSNKINYKSSNFYVDFYQLDANYSKRIWESRVFINDSQLHTVGQHLGGICFNVPMYDFPNRGNPTFIERPVDVYFQFVKTKKNRPTDIEARSDPRLFQYKPSNNMRMMKRPKRFTEPEEEVLSKIVRGLSQPEPQPQHVVQRKSVLRQPPAKNFPLSPIEESPGNSNVPGQYPQYPQTGAPQFQIEVPGSSPTQFPPYPPTTVNPQIRVQDVQMQYQGSSPAQFPPSTGFSSSSGASASTTTSFPGVDLGGDLGVFRNVNVLEPRSPEDLAPITESLMPLSPGQGVIQQPRTPQTSLMFGNMSIGSPDPQPPVMTTHPTRSQSYTQSSSHYPGYGSSHVTNTGNYQGHNNGFPEDLPEDLLDLLSGSGGEILNGLHSHDGHETSREGTVVADGIKKKKSSKSGRKEAKSERDEAKSERKESKSERKEMRRKVKEKREKDDVTRAMNQLKL